MPKNVIPLPCMSLRPKHNLTILNDEIYINRSSKLISSILSQEEEIHHPVHKLFSFIKIEDTLATPPNQISLDLLIE